MQGGLARKSISRRSDKEVNILCLKNNTQENYISFWSPKIICPWSLDLKQSRVAD